MRKGWFFVLGLMLLILSCSKGGGDTGGTGNGGNDPHVYNPTDVTAPTITINTPLVNQVFISGNTINVSGTVSDDLGLYRGQIRIIDNENGVEMKQQAYEIHGLKSYNFSLSYVSNVTAARTYTIAVFFEDHGYNPQNRSVEVTVNP